jgi:pimeloyl-ACP methyl ester carboxylesterase
MREAYRTGIEGTLEDTRVLARPWGFRLEDVRVPVHLWHGEQDTLAPVNMGRLLANAIPGCRAHFLPDVGHLVAEHEAHWHSILQTLKKAG